MDKQQEAIDEYKWCLKQDSWTFGVYTGPVGTIKHTQNQSTFSIRKKLGVPAAFHAELEDRHIRGIKDEDSVQTTTKKQKLSNSSSSSSSSNSSAAGSSSSSSSGAGPENKRKRKQTERLGFGAEEKEKKEKRRVATVAEYRRALNPVVIAAFRGHRTYPENPASYRDFDLDEDDEELYYQGACRLCKQLTGFFCGACTRLTESQFGAGPKEVAFYCYGCQSEHIRFWAKNKRGEMLGRCFFAVGVFRSWLQLPSLAATYGHRWQ